MSVKIQIPKQSLKLFCQRCHILRLSIFGSALRDDFGPDSDIDILVEFDPAYVPGFFKLAEMEDELRMMFGGQKIDLRTPQDLSRYFRDEVLAAAEVCYVRE